MVEEEAIGEMAHHNNAEGTPRAGRALDETVALVHAFAREHRGTLVVVVGDHETGGLAVEELDPDEPRDADSRAPGGEDGPLAIADPDRAFTVDWSTSQHTARPPR